MRIQKTMAIILTVVLLFFALVSCKNSGGANGGESTLEETRYDDGPITEVTYSVIFADYDGTILKHETVKKGKNATAPVVPKRDGYTFIGWNRSYDKVEQDIIVTAKYEIVSNQVCINYLENADGTITAKVSINGDVNLAMIELQLSFELMNATYQGYDLLVKDFVDANYVDEIFYFSFMSVEDIKADTDLFSITFAAPNENVSISFTVIDSVVSDGSFTNVTTANVAEVSYIR